MGKKSKDTLDIYGISVDVAYAFLDIGKRVISRVSILWDVTRDMLSCALEVLTSLIL